MGKERFRFHDRFFSAPALPNRKNRHQVTLFSIRADWNGEKAYLCNRKNCHLVT